MNHKNLIGVVLLLFLTSLFVLSIKLVNVQPTFSLVQSVSDLRDATTFSSLFYLFSSLAIGGSIYFSRRSTAISLAFLLLYSFAFLNLWVLASSVHVIGESVSHVRGVTDECKSGAINYSLRYQAVFRYFSILDDPWTHPRNNPIFREYWFWIISSYSLHDSLLTSYFQAYWRSSSGYLGEYSTTKHMSCFSNMQAFHPEVF